MNRRNHHEVGINLGGAIVIACAAWPIVSAATKRVLRRKKGARK
jgi:hypothetical protein